MVAGGCWDGCLSASLMRMTTPFSDRIGDATADRPHPRRAQHTTTNRMDVATTLDRRAGYITTWVANGDERTGTR